MTNNDDKYIQVEVSMEDISAMVNKILDVVTSPDTHPSVAAASLEVAFKLVADSCGYIGAKAVPLDVPPQAKANDSLLN